ncbi:MAG: DUF456 domain-containing protein [Cytophagaceae bacterium]|jgi:uncharacterized protein YqgC (DUF456 family)|nr:DUF456 domain-containing protein [Cytophagaceae bacterium]
MDYFLIIIAGLLLTLGLIGCIVPALPGPPLSYGGILILHFTHWGNLSISLLVWLAVFTVIVTVMDYVLPIWTTRKFGGSKRGVWGSTIGLVVGLFFAPWGIILGPFLGAFIGEMTSSNNSDKALRSAIGSFVGFLLGTGAKFAVCGVMIYFFVVELFFQ